MSSESEKEKESKSLIDQEEEAPTIGLNSKVIATGKTGLRFRLKFSMPRDHNEEVVASDNVNGCKKKEDHNEEASSAVVSAETKFRKAVKSPEQAQPVSKEGELKERAEGCGSSESSEIHTCDECLKTFPSFKSLYGHLRCHPERTYRGAKRPARCLKRSASGGSPPDRALPVSGWAVKRKRWQSIEEEAAVVSAAETLVIISQSKHCWGSFNEEEVKTEEAAESESPEKITMVSESARKCSSPAANVAKTYQCSTCNKSFNTHQALGGHKASHIKHMKNNNAEAEVLRGAAQNGVVHADSDCTVANAVLAAEHRCKYCNETFATGQALGGHMRRHWSGPPAAVSSPERVKGENHVAVETVNENQNGVERARSENRSSISFDLNEVPPQLEEEEEEERAPV